MEIMLRYGRRGLSVLLPDGNVRHVLRFRPLPAVANSGQTLRDALASPDCCAPLTDLAAGRRDACIVTAELATAANTSLQKSILGAPLADLHTTPSEVDPE